MPGSIQNASPTGVLPRNLCTKFVVAREWRSRVNEYHDGTRQTSGMVSTSRRTFRLAMRLTPSDAQALYSFWLAHQHVPFYFYEPKETAPGQLVGANYDATGVSLVGRYTVRFSSDWAQTMNIAFSDVAVELVEVA